ncbi:MAG: hypothetical protein R3B99_15930 [Polyangiales bacterium]
MSKRLALFLVTAIGCANQLLRPWPEPVDLPPQEQNTAPTPRLRR